MAKLTADGQPALDADARATLATCRLSISTKLGDFCLSGNNLEQLPSSFGEGFGEPRGSAKAVGQRLGGKRPSDPPAPRWMVLVVIKTTEFRCTVPMRFERRYTYRVIFNVRLASKSSVRA